MSRPTCQLAFFFFFTTTVVDAQISLRFDYSNADKTIAILKKPKATAEEIERFIASAGVQAIIRKIHSNDSIGKVVIGKLLSGEPCTGKEKDFQYENIKRNLVGLEQFIETVKKNEKAIRDSVEMLASYVPVGKQLDVTVCFLLGGYSSGFTFSKSDIFYIGTHQYQFDFKSIVNSCQHELFHNIQNLYQERGPIYELLEQDTAALYAFYIAQNFFTEGAAEFVADLDKVDGQSPNIKHLREHASVNGYRMADNFYLADRLILDVYRQPSQTDPGAVYRILFDWNWNNPGYAMGKYMMQSLVKKNGTAVMKKYLECNPLVFLKDYILLSRSDSTRYPYQFSPAFESAMDGVLQKIEATQPK